MILNVLESARLLGLRGSYLPVQRRSTRDITDEYGPPMFKPLPEDYPKWPKSVYGIEKLACEQLGNYYAAHFGFTFMAFRFGATYGPMKVSRHGRMQGHGQMIENAMLGCPPGSLTGRTRQTMCLCEGCGARNGLGCISTKVRSAAFNIGTGRLTHARPNGGCGPRAFSQSRNRK